MYKLFSDSSHYLEEGSRILYQVKIMYLHFIKGNFLEIYLIFLYGKYFYLFSLILCIGTCMSDKRAILFQSSLTRLLLKNTHQPAWPGVPAAS